jgi:hypothetical protein
VGCVFGLAGFAVCPVCDSEPQQDFLTSLFRAMSGAKKKKEKCGYAG